jgi:hypothetical protein
MRGQVTLGFLAATLGGLLALGASAQSTWTGATSTDWFISGNWSAGVPTASVDAIIPSAPTNQPTVGAAAACQTLTILTGARLTVSTGNLDVHGPCTNGGTLQINTGLVRFASDFTNNGTLNPGTGTIGFFKSGTKNLKPGSATFHNVTVFEGNVNAFASITAASLLVNALSAFNFSVFNHTISGNCIILGGVTGTGELILTGTGTLQAGFTAVAAVRVTGGTRNLTGVSISRDLTLTGGTTRVTGGTVNVLGNLSQQTGATLEVDSSGVLDVGGSTTLNGPATQVAGRIVCRGPWTSGSTFKPTGGTVQFAGATVDVTAPSSVFADVEFLPFGSRTVKTPLDVNGKLTVQSGAKVDFGAMRHTVQGGFVMAGTLIATGVIELDGSGEFTASPNGVGRVEVTAGTISVTSAATVTTSLHVKGGQLRATTGTLTVNGPFTVDAGAAAGTDAGGLFDLNGAVTWNGASVSTGGTIQAASTWTSTAAFAPTAGDVALDGGTTVSFTHAGAFHGLRIDSGTKTPTNALDVNGRLRVAAGGTLGLGGAAHKVAGGLDIEGTLTHTPSASIEIDGAGDLRVTTTAPDLTVTGGPVTANTIAVLGGRFRVASTGSFTMTQGTLRVAGDVVLDRAIAPTGGTIELAGAAATVTGVGSRFHHLTVTGGPKKLSNVFTIGGKLTVASGGTLDIGAATHLVSGGLDMTGSLAGTGLLELDGPGPLTASATVPRLRISGGPIVVSALARIGDPLEVTASGRVDVGPGGDLRVAGDVKWHGACRSTGGTIRCGRDFTATGTGFQPQGGAVILDGTGSGSVDAPGAIFQSFQVAGGSKTAAPARLAFDASLEVTGGSFTTAGGVVLSPGPSAAVRVLAAGTLRLHGDSWRKPVVAAGRAGTWSFEVKGTLGLRYFTVTDLDPTGLHLNGGGFETDPDLGNGLFDAGASGGAYLRFTAFTATSTLKNVYFKSDPGGGAKNVSYGGNQGRVVFLNAIGQFKGLAHEADPNGRVDWVLGPSRSFRLTEIHQDTPRAVEVTAAVAPVDLDGRFLVVGKKGGSASTIALTARVLEIDDYVEMREGSGTSGPNLEFLGTTLPWTVGGGGFAALQNTTTAGGVDFVRWGGSTRAAPTGTTFTDARGPLPAPAAGQSLGRDMIATDTDTREDWEPGSGRHATYPTRGARNLLFGLPYVWQGGETPNPFTVDAPGASNLWHVDTKRFFNPNKLKHEAGPPPDVKAWAFNTGAPGYDYDTGGRVVGALRSPPVRLPGSTDVKLSFFEWLQTENATGKDECTVEMRQLGTSTWIRLARYTGNISSYAIRTLDVSALKGKDVEFRWTFDSVDAKANAFEGWYVDYVAVYEGSKGLPFVPPGQNQPPPAPSWNPPQGEVLTTNPWYCPKPGEYGAVTQSPALQLALIGSNGLGIEVRTGMFRLVRKPGKTQDVIELMGIPPVLAPFVAGEPYPEFRFPLPVLPGMRYGVMPIQALTFQLPTGLPSPVPDKPFAEVVPPTNERGPELRIRPFGLDATKQPEQRHTIRLALFWMAARQ